MCCLNDDYKEYCKNKFDIVIRANEKKECLNIEIDESKGNLYSWYESLNHSKGLAEIDKKTYNIDKIKDVELEDYKVGYKDKIKKQTKLVSLLTFNLQLNQILMMINNPILFPHIAYAKMFNKFNEYIIALSIDKVQTLLFEVIHSHEQEKQKETGTLRQIKSASKKISNGFFEDVDKAFKKISKEILLKCSGVVIFKCSGITEDEIIKHLNQLFQNYYSESQGQKFLKYTYFIAENHYNDENKNNILNVQKAKSKLKISECTSKIIESNKDILFSFQKAKKTDNSSDSKDKYELFVQGINELYPYEENNTKNPYEANHFPIAVIKADLNGMGNMFASINDYEEYKRVSDILKENISLVGLLDAAKNTCQDNDAAWIYPFYVAGDDIFFAVSVTNLFKGIDVCRQMVITINNALIKKNEDNKTKIKNKSDIKKLSMGIGVSITFNREPIRYYLEAVNDQLDKAKNAVCPETLQEFLQTTIAINNQTFFDVDYDEINNKIEAINKDLNSNPIWRSFKNDIKDFQSLNSDKEMREQICSTSFLYSLLEKLSSIKICDKDVSENNDKISLEKELEYINILLYSLRLKHLDNSNIRNKELLFKSRIIKQLYVVLNKDEDKKKIKKKYKKANKKIYKDTIVLNDNSKHRLETYIQLLILLTDPRYNLNSIEHSSEDSEKSQIENAHKFLLKETINYLYEKLYNYDSNLLNIFINKDDPKNNNSSDIYFKRLNIEKSMFFKLRDTDKVSIEKAAELIKLKNQVCQNKDSNVTKENKKNTSSHMCFDEDKFKKAAKNSWNSTFIDSLMLLYQYNEMNIKLNGIFKEEEK